MPSDRISFRSQAITPFLLWVGAGHYPPHRMSGAIRHRLFPWAPIIAHHTPGVKRLYALISAAQQAAAKSDQGNFANEVEKNIQIVLGRREMPQALGHLQADGAILYDSPMVTAYVQLVCAAYKGPKISAAEASAIWKAVKEDTHVHELVEALLRRSPIEHIQKIRNRALALLRDKSLNPLRYGLAANDAAGAAFHLIAQLVDDQGRDHMFGGWLLDLDKRDRRIAVDLMTRLPKDNPVWIAFEAVKAGTLTRAKEIRGFEKALSQLPEEESVIESAPGFLGDPDESNRLVSLWTAMHREEQAVFQHLKKHGLNAHEINWVLNMANIADKFSLDRCMKYLQIPPQRQGWFRALWNDQLPVYMKGLWPELRVRSALTRQDA